jgi:GTP-binding protein Era
VRANDLAILRDLPATRPIVLVLNKIDKIGPKAALIPVLEAWAIAHPFAAIVPISALKRNGIERVLAETEKLLPEGPHAFDPDTLSDRPVRFFVAEYVREQVLKRTREEVPHGVAVTVESFDEEVRVPRIELAVHVDKESHKGILVGAGGAMLKAIGIDARRRVEALLGRKVFLHLWVRVTPGWYEDERTLADFGYAGTSP